MKTLETIDHWSESHPFLLVDLIRFVLGIFILIKGISFATDLEGLNAILLNSKFEFIAAGLMHYVIFSHIVGGLLIAIGLKTRIAVLFQLPILLGAVIFINAKQGFYTVNSELGISITALALLIVFLIYGSGKYSVDKYMDTHKFY